MGKGNNGESTLFGRGKTLLIGKRKKMGRWEDEERVQGFKGSRVQVKNKSQ
jgi:hypothetical protein